jgi:hypothetical protein
MIKRLNIFLSSIVALVVWTGNAHAAVIETNEWSNITQAGWVYSVPPQRVPALDASAGSPSGGGALKLTYGTGTFPSSTGAGVAEFNGSFGTDVYVGNWIKLSPGFTFNPFSTKLLYMWVEQGQINLGGAVAAFTIREERQGTRWAVDATIQQSGQLGSLPRAVYAPINPPLQKGVWFWLEFHVRMNDVIGTSGSLADVVGNGVLEIWLDDVLQGTWTNMRWRDRPGNTWRTVLLDPVWGGGGGVIPATQSVWFDHTIAPRSPILNFAN